MVEKHRNQPGEQGEKLSKSNTAGNAGLPIRGHRMWWGVFLLLLSLEIAVFSVEQARWITPQPWLTLVLLLSAATAGLLVWSRLLGWLAYIMALVGGLLVTAWQAVMLLPTNGVISGLVRLFDIIKLIGQPVSPGPSEETIGFAVLITFLVWIFGYVSIWLLLKWQNVWVGISLGAALLLINLNNLPSRYHYFLMVYFFVAMLLVAWNRIFRHNSASGRPPGFSPKFWVYLAVPILCIAITAGTVSWAMPQARAPGLQTAIATGTMWTNNIVESGFNVFNSVPAKKPVTTAGNLDTIELGEVWHSGDQVEFIVNSPQPAYWQARVYSTYDAGVWSNPPITDYLLGKEMSWSGFDGSSGRDTLTYAVDTAINSDILLNGGSFVSSDIPAVLHVSDGDVVGAVSPRVLSPGEKYTVTVTMPRTSPEALAATGEDYPPFVREKYLQLPPDFSESVSRLSAEITSGAASPYQKVTAIYEYVSDIPYSQEIKAAPPGEDDIEYFLFTRKSGFCAYFATAMTVMLRSAGVPARLATGYLPGEPGEQAGEYLLRNNSYHAWSQVYFPGYGWVDVEATPSGSQSPGSEVDIETPWVSSGMVPQSPQYEYWQEYWENQSPSASGGTNQLANQGYSGELTFGLPFADELGKALIIIIGVFLAVLVLGSPILLLRRSFSRWLWHVDRTSLASVVYSRMCALGSVIGMGPRPQQTPMEYAAQMAGVFPQQGQYFNNVARAYMDNRFGRRGRLGLFEEAELLKARCLIFETLLKHRRPFDVLFSRRYG